MTSHADLISELFCLLFSLFVGKKLIAITEKTKLRKQ